MPLDLGSLASISGVLSRAEGIGLWHFPAIVVVFIGPLCRLKQPSSSALYHHQPVLSPYFYLSRFPLPLCPRCPLPLTHWACPCALFVVPLLTAAAALPIIPHATPTTTVVAPTTGRYFPGQGLRLCKSVLVLAPQLHHCHTLRLLRRTCGCRCHRCRHRRGGASAPIVLLPPTTHRGPIGADEWRQECW